MSTGTICGVFGLLFAIWLISVLSDFKTALENIRLELVTIRDAVGKNGYLLESKLDSIDMTLHSIETRRAVK